MEKRKLTDDDLERMRIPKRFRTAQYSAIDCTFKVKVNGEQTELSFRDVIDTYFKNLEVMFRNGVGMYCWGKNGNGKTSAAIVALKSLRQRGITAMYLEYLMIKDYVINKVSFDEYETMWQRAMSVDVLLIDDVGKGVKDTKGTGEEFLKMILKQRSADMKITWMTSQISPDEFETCFGTSSTSTAKECFVRVEVVGPDRREESARQITNIFKRKP